MTVHAARRPGGAAMVAVVALVSLVLGACSALPGDEPAPTALQEEPATTPATGTLNGTALPDGPVLAVKIDGTGASRPRIGVQEADVVYVEPVEGGLTRWMAVFSSQLPAEVGPVRSARESDVDILAGYGPVAFAFSGASGITRDALTGGRQLDVDADTVPGAYHRDSGRRSPYNLIGETEALLDAGDGSLPPEDVGFVFGPAPPAGAPTASIGASWSSSSVDFTWAADEGRWLLTTDDRPDVAPDGSRHGATTVVVQRVRVSESRNRDVNGAPTPIVEVVGSGTGVVGRDGARWDVTWDRPGPESPTVFTTADGSPMTFAPGQVWVVFVGADQPVAVG